MSDDYIVRHVKRGFTYKVLGRGLLQSSFPIEDMQELVIYQGEDGQIWARPPQEFHDGRFEIVEEAQ